jgi:hypothetical protein
MPFPMMNTIAEERKLLSSPDFLTQLVGIGVASEVQVPNGPSTVLVVNFDSETAMGRITRWDNGGCHLQVIRLADSMTTYERNLSDVTFDGFRSELRSFLAAMNPELPSNS